MSTQAMMCLRGVAAAPGVGMARAVVLDRVGVGVRRRRVGAEEVEAEVARLRKAIEASVKRIEAAREALRDVGKEAGETHEELALVLEVHLLLHRDELVVDGAVAWIREHRRNAEWAIMSTVSSFKERLAASDSPYLRERAHDLDQVAAHILEHLVGETQALVLPEEPCVVVARDLRPDDAVRLSHARVRGLVRGLVTEVGSATSHTAILAKALGVPTVVGVTHACAHIHADEMVIVDGARGDVWVRPDDATKKQTQERGRQFDRVLRKWRGQDASAETLVTKDGQGIELHVNIELAEEVTTAMATYAAGVGLYRTEYLFLDRTVWPTEDEQRRAYQNVLHAFAGKPVIFRTFDLGADKMPSPASSSSSSFMAAVGAPVNTHMHTHTHTHMHTPRSMNPALGLRAIRLALTQPQQQRTQIRAILRAVNAVNRANTANTANTQVARIMFPLIATIDELRAARALVQEVQNELRTKDKREPVVMCGAMIEVPAAAVKADILARECDFFSVGTNDLIQYTLACDRGDASVSALANALDPAVLRLLDGVVQAAHAAEIRCSVCGDMAGDLVALPLLLGLGYRRLSVPMTLFPFAQEAIRRIDAQEAHQLVQHALRDVSAKDVEARVRQALGETLHDLWAAQGRA